MKMINRRAYERPQSEVFDIRLENTILDATIDGGKGPVDDAEEGNVSGWGWN